MALTVNYSKQRLLPELTNRASLRRLRRLKPEICRLATFRTWKKNTQCFISPAVLSRVGFLYTGKGDKVKCESCGLEIEDWKPGMDPKQEHIMRSPQCQLALDEEIFSKSDSIISSKTRRIPSNDAENSDYRKYTDHGGGNNAETSCSSHQKTFLLLMSTSMLDEARTYTLSNWPSITPSAIEMANAGWWYTNIADRVICIHCDVMFHSWNETDRPYEIHRLKSPQCFFIRTEKQKPMNIQRQAPVPIATVTDMPNAQTVVGAIHAEYAAIFRRHQTFQNWPEAEQASLPSEKAFVDAGFFYTGDNTVVRCFYCNGALRNWQAGDDPKIEHARWFPQCAYIRQYIGENLYQAVQRKNRELRAQKNVHESNHGEGPQCAQWTNDEIDRMVKARLDLPVVEKLRLEGYAMAIIRKVYEMQLRFKKDDFKTDVDLRIACLILDKQVKLINGNEANILIPAKWLSTQMQHESLNNNSDPHENKNTTLAEKLETAKTIRTMTPQTTVNAKTDEQSPCLLCLTTERQVACLPCGHLTSCVACGHSLKTCPLCRAVVKAFVRIYT